MVDSLTMDSDYVHRNDCIRMNPAEVDDHNDDSQMVEAGIYP